MSTRAPVTFRRLSMAMRTPILSVLCFALPTLTVAQERSGARRFALVVGNAAYEIRDRLQHTIPDAKAMKASLDDLGFQTTLLLDATRSQFTDAVNTITQRVRAGDVVVLYYAGHGVEVRGRNYLIPIDFKINRHSATLDAIPISDVLAQFSSKKVLSITILDACRDNPFPPDVRERQLGGVGLAAMKAAPGTLIAFATQDRQTVKDDGLFTRELVRALSEPGLGIHEVFRRTRQNVALATDDQQRPAVYEDLIETFVFRPGARSPAVSSRSDAEVELWREIKDSTNPRAFDDYLARVKRREFEGIFTGAAEDRLSKLRLSPAPPAPRPPVPTRSADDAGVIPDWLRGQTFQNIGWAPPGSRATTLFTYRWTLTVADNGRVSLTGKVETFIRPNNPGPRNIPCTLNVESDLVCTTHIKGASGLATPLVTTFRVSQSGNGIDLAPIAQSGGEGARVSAPVGAVFSKVGKLAP